MNNRYQNQRLRRISEVRSSEAEERQQENPMSRSMFFGYSSLVDMISEIFQGPTLQQNSQPVMTRREIPSKQENQDKKWEEEKKRVSTVTSTQTMRMSQRITYNRLKEKIALPHLPNTQRITQKLFTIFQQRVHRLQKGEIEPIFMETTISMTKDDIKQLFSNMFIQSKPNVIKNLNLILKCFAVHRLDIGQRQVIAMFAALLFGVLNQNVFLTFVQLCHMTLSSCFVGFVLQNELTTQKIQRQIQYWLEQKCPGVYVLLGNKYKVTTKFYVNHWIGSLFLCLQIQGISTKLDRYYENNQDEFILRVLQYLFIYRFSKSSLIHVTLCLMKSLEKQIFRQDNRQSVLNIFKRPRSFMDEKIFFRELSQ